MNTKKIWEFSQNFFSIASRRLANMSDGFDEWNKVKAIQVCGSESKTSDRNINQQYFAEMI